MSANETLSERARGIFPGGVNSPVRAWGAVGGTPRFIERAAGAWVWDADGTRYLDYVSSWGAILLGHADPAVVEAVREAAGRGMSYGAPTPGEIRLGELIRAAMPSVERLRFTSSGTEAVMSAVRLARAHTGRAKVVTFAGGYHGHADALLAAAGSGLATLGLPGSAGVPPAAVQDTLVLPYNDADAVADALRRFPGQIAAVLVEPAAANMGLVLPRPGFLEALRSLTGEAGALLVFDEVITGFRVAPGGAQERFGVVPDLTCLGKVIGGGLPVGAFGGRAGILAGVAPEGPVYQAGTLSGNPLAMAAGAAVLEQLVDAAPYAALEERTARLAAGLAAAGGDGVSVVHLGSLLTVFWTPRPPLDLDQVKAADRTAFARFFHCLLEQDILLPPSGFEAWFLTHAHGAPEIDATIAAAAEAFAAAAAAAPA